MKKVIVPTKQFHHGSPVYRLVQVAISKYKPHQGKKECARRLKQLAKQATHD